MHARGCQEKGAGRIVRSEYQGAIVVSWLPHDTQIRSVKQILFKYGRVRRRGGGEGSGEHCYGKGPHSIVIY